MRKVLLSLLVLCVVPTVAMSQEDCPDCLMGIYDTDQMVENFGIFDAATKEVFIGMKFDPIYAGLAGVEFSIYGLDPFFFTFTPAAGTTVVLGDIKAPLDREDTTGGGMNMAWATCQESINGQFVFGKITLIALGAAPDDTVLWVEKKYPSSNPTIPQALFNKCDGPVFTAVTPATGCYVINPTVNPGEFVDGCQLVGTAVESAPWSEIKQLYR